MANGEKEPGTDWTMVAIFVAMWASLTIVAVTMIVTGYRP